MKKIFIFLLLIFLNPLLNAQRLEFDAEWIKAGRLRMGALQFSYGANSSGDERIIEYELNIGNISLDIFSLNEKTIPGIGVTLNLVNIKNMLDNNYLSLFNFQVYWDIFALFGFGFYGLEPMFGPFVSINYAPNFDFNKYILCAGVRYILTYDGLVKNDALSFECCYKLFEGKNYIYFGFTFDLITVIPAIFQIIFRA